jgi:hypothetical protein
MVEKVTAVIQFYIFNIPLSKLECLIEIGIIGLAEFAQIRAIQAAQTNTRVATGESFWARQIAYFIIAGLRAF